ncbi:lysophospholipid acyltransferase family protein [Lactobacillus xylocopicola]|uniref:1-acyl-sn-glycerol-3-phosphate acyltransferase n=1 Tax=Lactobacillus xylocopicola TaxID=2976676 RepID=A0ABM8BEZ3_9LACO|nr:lysophospholipid acyltransferase family protein [Lactobacillus xylocopicola]BDR59817.1 1-acyl-sn-glycerol-3-phosphate acyltransferase [Lactobacillus xylocopicola]
MIIGANREQVIKNIKAAVERGDWNAKVEVGDPELSLDERKELVEAFWQDQASLKGKVNDRIGHLFFAALMRFFTATTKFTGVENLADLPRGGAIITANHFNQFDSLPIKHLASKTHHRLSITIEDTNLKLPGLLCYLMNYVGTIPLVQSPSYVGHEFPNHLREALNDDHWVLIYPEEEMWWNYRKPRKFQRGAYYFAALQNVPIISTFIEIKTSNKLEKGHPDFLKTKYIVHVLPPIYPNTKLSVNENSKWMMERDYQQKVTAYEQVYHRKLDYSFTAWDIAGWRQSTN